MEHVICSLLTTMPLVMMRGLCIVGERSCYGSMKPSELLQNYPGTNTSVDSVGGVDNKSFNRQYSQGQIEHDTAK